MVKAITPFLYRDEWHTVPTNLGYIERVLLGEV
jgi:hypothetical protein